MKEKRLNNQENTHTNNKSDKLLSQLNGKNEFDKFYKDLSNHNKDLLLEIEDLEMQVLEMLELCFSFTGLKDEFLENALEAYTALLDIESDEEFSKEVIKRLIIQVKKENPIWFNKSN